jgi:V8-like Glu-specific endopeptidase
MTVRKPPVGGTEPDKRVDLATAERIVAEAVARATDEPGKVQGMVAARVEQARRRATRDNVLLTLGFLVTFGALLATAVYLWHSRRAAAQLAAQLGVDRPPAAAVQGTIPARVMTGREIYDDNRAAIYVIGFATGTKIGGVCTAFAVRPNVLATNAHCITAYRSKGGTPTATENDSSGKVRHRILAAQVHPAYKPAKASADSPDVGLVRIEGTASRTVTLANDAEIRALGPGDNIFVLGFPGRLMDPVSPSLTFVQGHIGRLVALGEHAPHGTEDAVLVQHDAITRGGNSGSPIFNQYGHVIGIHAAHLDDEDEVRVAGEKAKVVEASPFRVGMRVDLLRGVPEP